MTTLPPTRTVGILGGMGPAAGADFTRLFVQACEAWLRGRGIEVVDQAFPEHWLGQIPLPERNAALMAVGASPLPGMIAALKQLAALGASSAAIACNTAHAWHRELQAACPELTLLHIVDETLRALRTQSVRSVGILSTSGTLRADLYASALERAGIACHVPRDAEQAQVMHGIALVKAGDPAAARGVFTQIAGELVERHRLATLILACTEIPLALQTLPGHPGVALLNPAELLARALTERAYEPPRVVAGEPEVAASFRP